MVDAMAAGGGADVPCAAGAGAEACGFWLAEVAEPVASGAGILDGGLVCGAGDPVGFPWLVGGEFSGADGFSIGVGGTAATFVGAGPDCDFSRMVQ